MKRLPIHTANSATDLYTVLPDEVNRKKRKKKSVGKLLRHESKLYNKWKRHLIKS